MGIFDNLRKKNNELKIKEIIAKDYKQKYFHECKEIWKNYVPKEGQAENLQGELLREIEKLRYEAQDNGNRNWDEDYSYFCDFISKSLCEQSIFSESEKKEITAIMSYIKECGNYAQKFNHGKTLFSPEKMAYVDDNLYDIISDKIGRLHKAYGRPVPYEKNDNIKR